MRHSKRIGYIMAAWVLLGMMTACQAAPSSPSPVENTAQPATISPTITPAMHSVEDVTASAALQGVVRIWLSWSSEELHSLQAVIDTFQVQNPYTLFAIAYYPERDFQTAIEGIETIEDRPTIVFAPSAWGPWIWSKGLAVDLTERIDAELESTVHPLAWSQVSYANAMIGLPLEMHGVVLYRNRSVVEIAPQTVSEWVQISTRLKEDGGAGIALDLGFDFSASHIAACKGSLFDESGRITLDSEQGRCWLNLLALIRPASRVTINTDDDRLLFESGQAGWIIDGTWNARRYVQSIGIQNLIVDPWPVYQTTEQPLAGYVWTENAYLVPGADAADLDATWAFLRFLLTPDVQLILSQSSYADHLTVLSDLLVSDVLQREIGDALFSGVPRPVLDNLDLYRLPVEGAAEAVAVQGADLDLAIDVAINKIELALQSSNGAE